MRTSFELKLVASTLSEAKEVASKEICKFLEISEAELENIVSVELKVTYPKAETVVEIEQGVSAGVFQVTAYGSVKQSVVRPFGA